MCIRDSTEAKRLARNADNIKLDSRLMISIHKFMKKIINNKRSCNLQVIIGIHHIDLWQNRRDINPEFHAVLGRCGSFFLKIR